MMVLLMINDKERSRVGEIQNHVGK